jgi:hypothetical protein
MPYAPQPAVVILFPDAGSNSGWDKSRGKPPTWQKREISRQPPWQRQPIPAPYQVDRELVRRIANQAKRHLAETKAMRACLKGWRRE